MLRTTSEQKGFSSFFFFFFEWLSGTHLDEVPPPPGIDPRAPPKVQPTPAFDRLVVDPLAHPCGKTALARDRTRD
ncbi:hypothetical protein HanRHA438_Chr00c22g0853061 [Helianthus annuus]|nr:hypothetical protein HanRHA438_Chr00c22g0853061 [Helianthus annuus]